MTEATARARFSRRGFIDWLLGTSAAGLLAAALYPVVRYLVPPEAAEADTSAVTLPFKPSDLTPNSARIFKFGSRPGILVRTPSGELRAFSATCTHLGCVVQHRPDLARLWCACHDGQFDLEGANASGPPPKPLDRFAVKVRGDQIVVSRSG